MKVPDTINIPVVVEFAAEDRERMDRFSTMIEEYLKRFGPVDLDRGIAEPAETAPAAPTAAAEEKPTKNPPEAEKPAEAAPAPTETELRSLVQKLVASGQRDAVKAIVQQYAARVSDVPEDKRAECIEQLHALEVKA